MTESLEFTVDLYLLFAAGLVVLSVVLSPLATRLGAPILLLFLGIGMLVLFRGSGEDRNATGGPHPTLHLVQEDRAEEPRGRCRVQGCCLVLTGYVLPRHRGWISCPVAPVGSTESAS